MAKLAPPDRVPLFVPAMSTALPSPGHQPTSPAGGVTQSADHASNAESRQKSPTAAHPEARMTKLGGLLDHTRGERPNGRTKATHFIMAFQLILYHRPRLCASAGGLQARFHDFLGSASTMPRTVVSRKDKSRPAVRAKEQKRKGYPTPDLKGPRPLHAIRSGSESLAHPEGWPPSHCGDKEQCARPGSTSACRIYRLARHARLGCQHREGFVRMTGALGGIMESFRISGYCRRDNFCRAIEGVKGGEAGSTGGWY